MKLKRKHTGIQCVHCKEVLYSWSTHDFKFCFCGRVAIDGGFSYIRILGNPWDFVQVKWDAKLDVPWQGRPEYIARWPY